MRPISGRNRILLILIIYVIKYEKVDIDEYAQEKNRIY